MRCGYDHSALGRCPNEATHRFVRYGQQSRPYEDFANVCDKHLMGDGNDGRYDYGWREVDA